MPIIRPLQLGMVNELPAERDDSLIPSVDVLEGFPGLWISQFGSVSTSSTTGGPATVARVAPASSTTTTMMPNPRIRSFLFPARFTYTAEDCVPWCLRLPTCFPDQHCDEVIVHTCGWGTFRLWAPRPMTALCLQRSVADALNIPAVQLCWPPMAPCLPGSPVHVAMWPSDLPPEGSLAIVDARRVGTVDGTSFWLCVLPDDATASSLVADVIIGRQLCSTPAGVRVDGFRPVAGFCPRPGVRVVTLLSGAAREQFCAAVNSDPFSRYPGTCSFPLTPPPPRLLLPPRGRHYGPLAQTFQSPWRCLSAVCALYEWPPMMISLPS